MVQGRIQAPTRQSSATLLRTQGSSQMCSASSSKSHPGAGYNQYMEPSWDPVSWILSRATWIKGRSQQGVWKKQRSGKNVAVPLCIGQGRHTNQGTPSTPRLYYQGCLGDPLQVSPSQQDTSILHQRLMFHTHQVSF